MKLKNTKFAYLSLGIFVAMLIYSSLDFYGKEMCKIPYTVTFWQVIQLELTLLGIFFLGAMWGERNLDDLDD